MHKIDMEITLLIMENHGIALFNFCGNLVYIHVPCMIYFMIFSLFETFEL